MPLDQVAYVPMARPKAAVKHGVERGAARLGHVQDHAAHGPAPRRPYIRDNAWEAPANGYMHPCGSMFTPYANPQG